MAGGGGEDLKCDSCTVQEQSKLSVWQWAMRCEMEQRYVSRLAFTCLLFLSFSFKAAGKYRQQGRNYTVEDGDIVFFKFNAGAGLTAKKK